MQSQGLRFFFFLCGEGVDVLPARPYKRSRGKKGPKILKKTNATTTFARSSGN